MKLKFGLLISVILITLALGAPNLAAQGRGRGSGRGSASPGGPPPGAGVDRGLSRSSDASNGRADTGRGTASARSNGRSDTGLDRARMAGDNLRSADNDLRNHPDIASDMHVNANDLRTAYQTALASNANLTFGQFVAATRLAHNFGDTNPAITRDAILAGLAAGNSIGKTLQSLGLSKDQANAAKKQVDLQMKQSRNKH